MSSALSQVAEVVLATAVPPAASISLTTEAASAPVRRPVSLTTTLRSLAREQQRVLPADAATGPGHDGHLAVESTHVSAHLGSLRWTTPTIGQRNRPSCAEGGVGGRMTSEVIDRERRAPQHRSYRQPRRTT